MDNYKNGGEGRRDYGHNTDRTYSSEGRVLRPRKRVASGSDNEPRGERVNYEERRSFGPRKPYGENRGGGRPYGENRGHGEGDSERRSNFSGNGERRSYGDGAARRSYNGPRKPYGENRGGGRPYGENRGHGEGDSERRSNFSGNGERRSYGDGAARRSYNGPRKPYGENRGGSRPYGKPGQGGRHNKPFRREESFNERDEAGINRMISRKPQLENMDNSDFDMMAPLAKDEIRLNKFIANSGVCSRREADTLIQAGVVTVNGEVITELGTKVNIFNDDVRFNGERLKGEEKVYVVMNKPKGFVTTASDPHADKTVMDLLKGCDARVFPVGRLDKATTGVLMFTNDGEIAERLTHPSYDKKKIYQVILDHELTQEDYDHILAGVTLNDGEVKADELEFIDDNDHRKLGIEIHSGKNRIVRRIFESLGYDVRALDRVYFAGLTKKGLQKGEWRYLSEGEVNILKMGAYL